MKVPTDWLTILYWLHLLATVAWVGGLVAMALFVLPAARRTLSGESLAAFLGQVSMRLQRIGWLSLIILVGTGMFQMSASPKYQGFLAITNSWAVAILIKHVVIGVMVLASAYLTWGLMPSIQRLALLQAHGKGDAAEMERLRRREDQLVRFNLYAAIAVLLLTALARSVG
jgi:uncharacterized membrane protein